MTKDCPQCSSTNNRKTVFSNSGENFRVAGKVQFIYAIDLRDFVNDQDRATFERLRGSERLAEAMKQASNQTLVSFSPDLDEDKTVDDGHRFAAFRTRFVEGWLFKTFYPNRNADPPRGSPLFELWKEYSYHVRLSRFGSVEVKLTRYIPTAYGKNNTNERESLLKALEGLLNIRLSGASTNLESALAIYIAARFVSDIAQIDVSEDGIKKPYRIRMNSYLGHTPETTNKSRIYERYTVLVLEHVECKECGYRLDGRELWDNNKPAIGAILEGNLLETKTIRDNEEYKKLSLPPIDEHGITHLRDLGSWQNDLCFFTHERALFYYPEVRMMITPFSSENPGDTSISYDRYWRCIIRMVEHTISMRTALHILESQTTKALSNVSDLTRSVIADNLVTDEEKRAIQRMAEDMAKNFSVLPYVRDALVPSSNLRASYAASKFEYLTERVFRLNYSLTHIERNIDEAFEFLQYFKSVQLQFEAELTQTVARDEQKAAKKKEEREQRIEKSFARIGAIIALLALVAVAPSFVNDFLSLFKDRYCKINDDQLLFYMINLCNYSIVLAISLYVLMICSGFLIIIRIYRQAIKP